MILSVNALINSLRNPSEQFLSIKDISLCGEEQCGFEGTSAWIFSARVFYKGRIWLLSCNLDTRHSICEQNHDLLMLLHGIDSQYLIEMEYHRKELVVEEGGKSYTIDIILKEYVEGESLLSVLNDVCRKGNRAVVEKLFNPLVDLIKAFTGHRLAFKLRLKDIIVAPNGTLRLTNYDTGAECYKRHLSSLLLMILLRSDLPLYEALDNSALTLLRRYFEPLSSLAESRAIRPLEKAVRLIKDQSLKTPMPSELIDLFDDLRTLRICVDDFTALENEVSTPLLHSEEAKAEPSSHQSILSLLDEYDSHGCFSCGAIAVCRNNLWGYVDPQGREITPLEYDWADDFYEDRAVVAKDSMFGVVDREGDLIVPLEYESIEWSLGGDVFQVSKDGRYGVLDRMGELVVPFDYDFLGGICNGLMPARVNDKYGYIDSAGRTVIPFIYDDAYMFNRGEALVVLEGKEIFIDSSGCRIDKLVEV